MERSSTGIVSQIGRESTPGTPVAANKLLKSISFNLKQKFSNQKMRAQGNRTPTVLARHKQWAEGDYEGILDYNTLPYILDCIFNAASPTSPATGAYQRVYTPGTTSADSSRKTLTVEVGDATAADQYAFVQIQSFSMEATQEDFNIKGSLISKYPTLNGSLTATPTVVAERPVQRTDVNLYLNDTYGDRGTTQLTKAQSEMLDISEKFIAAWFHNRAITSFTDVVEKDYEPTFEFTLSHDSASRSLLASIAANPEKFMRWEARGALIADTTYELIQIDLALRFDEPEEIKDSDGVYAYKYKCTAMPNTDLGSYMTIKTINTIATL